MNKRWFIPAAVRLQLLSWSDDDEKYVCCNQATSDLYLIAPLGKFLLEQLGHEPTSVETLYQVVSQTWEQPLTPELKQAIDHHLHTFSTIDLLESLA